MNTDSPGLFGFLQSMLRNWLTAMSGSLSVPFAFFGVFAASDSSRTIWIVSATSLFLVASYRLWSAERSALIDALGTVKILEDSIETLNDTSKPNIRLEWHQTIFAAHEEEDGTHTTLLFVNCAAINAGHPVALDRWEGDLFYKGSWHELQLNIVHGNIRIGLEPYKELTVPSTDMLYAKASLPIERGTLIRGWLLFRLPNTSREELGDDRKLRISCLDAHASPHSASVTYNEGELDGPYGTRERTEAGFPDV